MRPGELTPPPVPAPASGPVGDWQPWRGVLAIVCLTVAARLALHWELPLPGCLMREFTGVPCPFCGATRSCAALAGLDVSGALAWNPLVGVGAISGFIWLVLCTVLPRLAARRLHQRGRAWVASVPGWGGLVVAVLLLNWIYLWVRLPR